MKSGNNIMPKVRKYLLFLASYGNLLIIITGKIAAECLFNIHAYKQAYIILNS